MKTVITFTNEELKLITEILEEYENGQWIPIEKAQRINSIKGYIMKYLKEGNK